MDNLINEVPSAGRVITLPPCLVFSWNLSCSCPVVSEIILRAGQTLFEICVAVKFGQQVETNSRFQMKAICILTHYMLQKSFLLKGEKGHVGKAWKGLNC